jgi:glycosyltransferase involved in cell wall biosynthesis
VLTSNIGSAPEIGGKHALYVDPYDVESITDGIDRLVEKTDFDPFLASEHAAGFAWDKTAKAMLQIYKDVYDGKLS